MVCSKIGEIIREEWLKTKTIRKNIDWDEFIIMPNHVHGIIIIDFLEATEPVVLDKNSHTVLDKNHEEPLQGNKNIIKDKGGIPKMTQQVIFTILQSTETTLAKAINKTTLKANSLGEIIGQFKSVYTKRISAIGNQNFEWQANYYEHIIRNQNDLERIRIYIVDNQLKWEEDKFYLN